MVDYAGYNDARSKTLWSFKEERKYGIWGAIIGALVGILFVLTVIGIQTSQGSYTVTPKEMQNYDEFARTIAGSGFSTNIADRISYDNAIIEPTEELGKYALRINTKKGTISYFVYKGGQVSLPHFTSEAPIVLLIGCLFMGSMGVLIGNISGKMLLYKKKKNR